MIEPSPGTLATAGELRALDEVLTGIQPGMDGLALRMLGQREDAADATQEILLKVVTHLASFRGGSALTTWVWSVARNPLLTARTRSAEHPEVSPESAGAGARRPPLLLKPVELAEAERAFRAYGRIADAAAVFRALPELAAPSSMRAAIRAVLAQEGFMDRGPPQ
jgi:RNA polymerase sigma factor (sigma-70 family)